MQVTSYVLPSATQSTGREQVVTEPAGHGTQYNNDNHDMMQHTIYTYHFRHDYKCVFNTTAVAYKALL